MLPVKSIHLHWAPEVQLHGSTRTLTEWGPAFRGVRRVLEGGLAGEALLVGGGGAALEDEGGGESEVTGEGGKVMMRETCAVTWAVTVMSSPGFLAGAHASLRSPQNKTYPSTYV